MYIIFCLTEGGNISICLTLKGAVGPRYDLTEMFYFKRLYNVTLDCNKHVLFLEKKKTQTLWERIKKKKKNLITDEQRTVRN